MPTPMAYPLLVSFTGTFFGQGFIAEVVFQGRLLARHEDDLWWLEGVNPGAISAEGESLDAANAHLREALKDTFVLFAGEAPSFGDFRQDVERFVYSSDDATKDEWNVAVDRVRQNKECLEDLPVRSAACSVDVSVKEKKAPQVTPDNNVVRAEISNPPKAA
jgi:hypothetical protein